MTIARSLKDTLGFSKGYVYLPTTSFRAREDLLRSANARYNVVWGWYWPSEIEEIPSEITTEKLRWEAISLDENTLRPVKDITSAISSLIFPTTPSEFVGSVGERIEKTVTVVKNIKSGRDGTFGSATFHVFRDDQENTYTWTTAAKDLPQGNKYTLRGTVKDHTVFQNDKQTVLTRCAIVKIWED